MRSGSRPAPRRQGQPVGGLLRQWRQRRRLSQLALAIRAEISTRHLSFVETGRAAPSRELVLHLAEELDVPLRERNRLLLAAGFAPGFGELSLDAPQLAAVRSAVGQVLRAHEPFPAMAVDRRWRLVDGNAAMALLTEGVAPELLAPPMNVLRATLHPAGLAGRVENLGEVRAHLLRRLRREVAQTEDPELAALLAELRSYPCPLPGPDPVEPGSGDVFVPLRLRSQDRVLSFFSTVTVFGTPLDVTVSELVIEAFFPADPATAAALAAGGP